MHQSHIPIEVLNRVVWLRGNHHEIEVDPARTAHIVVDLQVGFMSEGALLEMPLARSIVENVNRVSQALRSADGTIAYMHYTFDPIEPHHWGSHYDRMTPDAVERIRAAFTIGVEQHALWSGLNVQPEDLIVPKTRWSACGYLRSRLAPKGQGHRYADHHRYDDELLLRVNDAGCDADGVSRPVRAGW
jgi:nicotinamidase-related amidase